MIRYMQDVPPAFAPIPYDGDRYERFVPDTLDLHERAALAVHGLTEPTDRDADYEIYWILFPRMRPPVMQHDFCDACQAKYIEALPLMRIASGSDLNEHIEKRWLEQVLQMQGPDGLLYVPRSGRPWCTINAFGPPAPGEQYFTIYFGARLLNAITVQVLRGGDDVWRSAGVRYVEGVRRLAARDGDRAFFPWMQFGPGGTLPAGVDPRFPPGYSMASWTGPMVAALTHFHRATGYEPALELASLLARWIVESGDYFGPDGSFINEPASGSADAGAAAGGDASRQAYAHFHSHTNALLALLDYGLAANDADILALVVAGFCFGRAQGDPTLGFFPEVIGRSSFEDCETCCVADMVSLALKLSAAGLADHWDDADRWIRNQLAENQMTRADWAWRLWEMGSNHPRLFDLGQTVVDDSYQSSDRAMERNLGGFASHAAPNDFSTGRSAITACCTGNGTRTLYHAWSRVVSYQPDTLRINLLLNHASRWADVDSHIPYDGRLTVSMKVSAQVSVRIPEWAQPVEVTCTVDGEPRALGWDGRYALVGTVPGRGVVDVRFPIAERIDRIYVQKHAFTIIRRGNEVVSIDPPGRYNPLYQRDHYRSPETRWRHVTRFVAEDPIAW